MERRKKQPTQKITYQEKAGIHKIKTTIAFMQEIIKLKEINELNKIYQLALLSEQKIKRKKVNTMKKIKLYGKVLYKVF